MNRGTHFTLGDIGRPEDRVVRIVNFHYEADVDDVRKFFGNNFTIVDFVRSINTKDAQEYSRVCSVRDRTRAHRRASTVWRQDS